MKHLLIRTYLNADGCSHLLKCPAAARLRRIIHVS